jgi:hypothetical protein
MQPGGVQIDGQAAGQADAYNTAEESLRQAVALTKQVLNQLKALNLHVTSTEAANMDALLQDLVLQAAAIGGRIHEQQTWQRPQGFTRF